MSANLPVMSPHELNNGSLRESIPAQLLGTATLDKSGAFEAGSYQSFTLTYTAGRFGIDDSGSLRIAFRFATDQSDPQFSDGTAPNYCVVKASNNAILKAHFDPKGNIRPWDRTLQIKIVNGFMDEGDTITVRFGVTDLGSPGMRLQTFCENRFEFRVLVDPIATYNFQTLPVQPAIRIVPGLPANWVAVIPTTAETGKPFTLKYKAEDTWGNPTGKVRMKLYPKASQPVLNLPDYIDVVPGVLSHELSGLVADESGRLDIEFYGEDGDFITRSNPMLVSAVRELKSYWADLHGQSNETLGTNSAADYFAFGRDLAFLDACAHQGNDFQMTETFWNDLNAVTAHFNEEGRFVTLPGYEWSGNTALGGDRNVYFPNEGRTMRRSSHALIEDQYDIDTDCHTAAELFEAFANHEEWDVICFAHCGGRYADISMAHDGRFEKSVEVHSAWGTFEWLVQDAFINGYRVGIIGNSDGHKGRPGASYPGAGWFGAVGGLTCYLMRDLSRESLLDCIKKRHHYATNGGPSGRIFMELSVTFDKEATVYHDDPALFDNSNGTPGFTAMMGDIVHLPIGNVQLSLSVSAASPVRCVDLYNGLKHMECYRPYAPSDLGDRIGVVWDGAEYRGRFRSVTWDGHAVFSDAKISSAQAVNFFNRDKSLHVSGAQTLHWQSVTTGNFAGFVVTLENSMTGTIEIDTPLVKKTLPLREVGYEDTLLDASATLPRGVRLFRLPAQNTHKTITLERSMTPLADCDNPYYVRVTLEDGTQAWSSPVYVIRQLAEKSTVSI